MTSKIKRLGFIILSADTFNQNTLRLFNQLNKFENSRLVIHHDTFQAKAISQNIIKKYNIILTHNIYRTYWSHINNVLATLDCIKILYNSTPSIDWFITLSPNCYPVKPITEIQHFYNNCTEDAFIDMHEIGNSDEFSILDRYLIRDFIYQPWFKIPFISKKGKLYQKTIRRKIKISNHPFLNENNKAYQGSNWLSFNRNVAQQLIDSDMKNNQLVQFYQKFVVSQPDMHPCPQETVLPTFIGNLPNIKVSFENYRYINWENCSGWSPNVLNLNHWKDLIASNAHWARKFVTGSSDNLLDKIDDEIL